MSSAPNPIQELITLHGMGRFADMEVRARALLDAQPTSPMLNELLGIALSALQRHGEALEPLQRAVHANPADAQFWENLALCQCRLGQFAEAETGLRKSLDLRPRHVESLIALAGALGALRRHDEAQGLFEQVLAIRPDDSTARGGLGSLCLDQGRLAEAAGHFRRAIATNPGVAAFHYQLGLICVRQGLWREAEGWLRRAIALGMAGFRAHARLAQSLVFQFRPADAGAAAEAAMRSLGDVATQVTPANIDLLDIVADAFGVAGRFAEAMRTHMAMYAFDKNPARAAAAAMVARHTCDWQSAAELEADACRGLRQDATLLTAGPFPLLMMASATPADQLAVARSYSREFAAAAISVRRPDALPRSPRRRIRVGYLSNDFFAHAIAHLIAGVIEAHDRARFEVFAYDYSPPSRSATRRRLENAFEHVVPIHDLPYDVSAQRIAQDGCDIAVDIKGWTTATRSSILAGRPGQVQVQWLGYPGSLGAPWIDYIVADSILIPPGDEAGYDEKVIRLPGTYQPNDDKRPVAAQRERGAYGLPDHGLVFSSFNQAYKITPELFDIWMKLLRDVDRSVLWLLDMEGDATERLRRRAASNGVAAERILFAPKLRNDEHLARLACADLALDCFPYGSHTTASDALWAGVPLVALKGDTFASRVSASILAAAGLSDLVTTSLGDYFNLARELATDRVLLQRTRARVNDCRSNSALFDTRRFTRNLETAFTVIFERHAAGLPPDHISIE